MSFFTFKKLGRVLTLAAVVAGGLLVMGCPPQPEEPDPNGGVVGTTPGDTTGGGTPGTTPGSGASMVDTAWYTRDPNAEIFNISTAKQLAGLAELVNRGVTFGNKTVNLTADISLSAYGSGYREGKGWVPIGGAGKFGSYDYVGFAGTFEGNKHVVSGLYINDNALRTAGLFGHVSGVIRNIGVVDVNIRASSSVGGLVGYHQNARILNCYATGTVKGGGNDVGGLVGVADGGNSRGFIGYSYSSCSVSGKENVGGIVGRGSCSLEVTMCYSTGAVQGNDGVGGITRTTSSGCGGGVVSYSAALNPSVKVLTGTAVGRVGDRRGGYSYNVAFDGITNNDGTTDWPNKGADKMDGADITAAQIIADGTIGARFTDDWGWTTENGKLPGLFGRAVDLPEHLRR